MASTSTMQSRESDSNTIPFCPIVHPTLKEFNDLNTYLEKLEKEYSQNYGMVKVIPPKSWKARQADYEQTLDDKMIIGPIEQNPYGKGGIYECIHIMKKSIPFREYKKKARDFDKVTDNKTIEKVEDLFWKNISFSPPLYGSDMQMSLFDDGVKWNMKEMRTIMNDGLNSNISGVNTPYLYIGSWKTLFAWHKEDLDLGALNYLHYGKPKFWYCIARSDAHKLESFAKANFAESFAKCPEFLRHKTTVINPYQMIKKLKGDIKISKMSQEAGEFIVVFSGAYHHGFNWGYNIAEAVNYATLGWLDFFPQSRQCRCASDNVSIDHNEFITTLLKNRPELKNRTEVKNFQAWLKQKQLEEQENMASEEETSYEQNQGDEKVEMKKSMIPVVVPEKKKRGRKSKKAATLESDEDSNNHKAETRENSIEPQRIQKKIQKAEKQSKQKLQKEMNLQKKSVKNSSEATKALSSPIQQTEQSLTQSPHYSNRKTSRKNSLNMEVEKVEQEVN
ncbi:hypothetical protein ABPG72_013915 [Tetrahymena utriculariae]